MEFFQNFRVKIKKLLNSKWSKAGLTVVVSVLIVTSIVRAGSLTPSASPAATFYTLTDIYTRLTTNTAAIEENHDFLPDASPVGTLYTLKQIYEAIPAIVDSAVKLGTSYLGIAGVLTPIMTDGTATTTATTADVFNSKTAHLSADWTLDVGTLDLACNTASFDSTDNLVPNAYDGDGGGNSRWCMKDTGDAAAGDIANSKIAWVDGSEITGTMFTNQKFQTKDDLLNASGTDSEYIGEEASWTTIADLAVSEYGEINYLGSAGDDEDEPNELDLYSGMIKRDNRTGLYWSDVAAEAGVASTTKNTFILTADGSRPTGGRAIGFCEALNSYDSGNGFAGYNDWYLPTQKQFMQSYIDGAYNHLPNSSKYFWSSTEHNGNVDYAWNIYMNYGNPYYYTKVTSYSVRCVRP